MKLIFLGTRRNIDSKTDLHQWHSSMKVAYHHNQIIIDCGEGWLDQITGWQADAIIVTHAHPDHVFGLNEGAPYPVYATEDSWETMDDFDKVIE